MVYASFAAAVDNFEGITMLVDKVVRCAECSLESVQLPRPQLTDLYNHAVVYLVPTYAQSLLTGRAQHILVTGCARIVVTQTASGTYLNECVAAQSLLNTHAGSTFTSTCPDTS